MGSSFRGSSSRISSAGGGFAHCQHGIRHIILSPINWGRSRRVRYRLWPLRVCVATDITRKTCHPTRREAAVSSPVVAQGVVVRTFELQGIVIGEGTLGITITSPPRNGNSH